MASGGDAPAVCSRAATNTGGMGLISLKRAAVAGDVAKKAEN